MNKKIKVKWLSSNLFKKKYIVVGDWDLSTAYSFPKEKVLSADTETHHYFKSKKLQDSELSSLYKENGANWCRDNIRVKGYAYMLSNGKDFALFKCIEDFIQAIAMFSCDLVIWYNAKFDFTQFDHYFLTHGWKDASEIVAKYKKKNRYGRFPSKTFQNLLDDMGHRYSMEIWISRTTNHYKNQVHRIVMKDLLNVIPGSSLRKQLEDWKIKDDSNEEVRKLKMDYVNDSVEKSIQYMINDTKGLHLLALTVDKALKEVSGYSFIEGDYMTAGSLAKKVMLDKMFRSDERTNKRLLHKFFPMTLDFDTECRELNLYKGGLCFINPDYVGKTMKNIYKYDVNSMYPAQMYNMLYPTEEGVKMASLPPKTARYGKLYIVCIEYLEGSLKENRVPVWRDSITGDFVSTIYEPEKRYIWLDELEELEWWYNLDYTIDYVIEYKGRYSTGMKDYVNTFYSMKAVEKGSKRRCAKLLLNSAYGKWAQRLDLKQLRIVLDGKHCKITSTPNEKISHNKSIMSVVVGSKISSNARISLLQYIREICKGDPKKYFIYCDTDSVHALVPYDKCDDSELGLMKCEGVYSYGKYLAPKTYLMYEPSYEHKWEVHTKGVNTSVVEAIVNRCKDFETASKIFAPTYHGHNITFKCLTALNVIGGKALIYVDKMLVQPHNFKEIFQDERVD